MKLVDGNLSMLYLELDFLDRFAACAQDGFKAVEFLFPYAFDKGEMGVPNLKVQMDLYHCQIAEGDLATKLRHYLPTGRVGHIQIAGVPQRHEPDLGELNYRYLFSVLDELSYTGWVGCEYRPQAGLQVGGTSAGLGWLNPIYEMPLVVQALFVQLRAIQ